MGIDLRHSKVDPDVLREGLERVLSSEEFVHSERLRRFLRHCFDCSLAGKTEPLREAAIGVEVFDCAAGYDTKLDPIVPVEARRLRQKLESYAARTGDPVSFVMPASGYGLQLRISRQDPAAHARRWRFRRRYRWMAGAFLLVAGVTALAIYLWRPRAAKPVRTSGGQLEALTVDEGVTADAAVTPDGRWLAYTSDRGTGGPLALFLQELPAGRPQRLTHGEYDAVEPSFDPAGLWIAYRWARPDAPGLYALSIRAGGGTPQRLTEWGERPRVSPDGKDVLFETPAIDGGAGQLWVVPATGGVPRQLVPDVPHASAAVWAPDGKSILFEGANAARQRDLYMAPYPAGAAKALGFKPRLEYAPGSLAAWQASGVYLARRADGLDSLVRLKELRPGGFEQRLMSDAFAQTGGVVAGRTIFASGERQTDILAVTLDADGYSLRGLQSAIETRVDDRAPSLDQAGRRIAWVADRGDRRIVYWRDLPNGRDNWLQLEPRLIDDPVLSPEGQRVIVRAFEPARQALWLADLRTGRARKVLADAGPPLEWSRDGRFVFYEPAGTPRATVARLDLMTGRAQVVLEHPEHGVRGVRVSPDAAWVAFHVEIAPGRRQIYLASNSGPVAVEEWRPVTPGLDLDFNPAWTADGKRILFLSNRDGHLCLWAQPVDLSRGEPVEDSFAVEHLHAAGRSIRLRAGLPYRTLGPVARGNQVYLSVEQWRSNIWSLRVP